MEDISKPGSESEVVEIIRQALADDRPLEILGAGSKRGFGRPVDATHRLTLAAMSGILLYQPEELVLTARAGTPLVAIQRELAAQGQCLAFEPPDFSDLLDAGNGAGTIGGAIACNCAGPRRLKAGSARDHILGFKAVSGRAEAIKSGGRVMKNVTGFDLSKLVAGSYGTLAVLTEVTVKVLPAPEYTLTLVVPGLDQKAALEAMSAAACSAQEVSGIAYLPLETARLANNSTARSSITALRLEGIEASVKSRLAALQALLGDGDKLEGAVSLGLWRDIRDVRYFLGDLERVVWRLSVPPAAAMAAVDRIAADLEIAWFCDWAGASVWLSLAPEPDCGAAIIRAAARAAGGHATLVRAPEDWRAEVPAFEPLEPSLFALTQRIKQGFDPKGILNPGRMYAGV